MRCRIFSWQGSLGFAVGLAVVGYAASICPAGNDKPLPPFKLVKETTLRHFSMLADYRPGDIITRSEVEPLFPHLKRMGWAMADRKTILHRVPADNDFLVRQLRTRQGRTCMREITNYPNAFDQLDRLSRLPNGLRTVRDLIQTEGGSKVIKYFTTTPDGAC